MTEAEHLDRLLRVVVQQEMRKLLLNNTDHMWNILCQQYFLMYGKSASTKKQSNGFQS